MNFVKIFVNLFQFNRTNWKAVALCFIAAAIFWLFNSFNKNYSANIRFPLRFDYSQEKFIPLTNLPGDVRVNVSGNGWELFRKSIGIKLPELTISLPRPTEVKKIVASSLIHTFSEQIGSGLKINYIVNDTLRLQIDELDSHKFKLVANLSQISFREGYGRVSPVVLLPDSVNLQGAKSLLHQMPDSIVLTLPKSELDEQFRKDVDVVIPFNESIVKNPSVAAVMFEVGAVEKTDLYVRAMLANANQFFKQTFADSLKVSVQIPKAQTEMFNEDRHQIVAIAEMKNKPKGMYRLQPTLKGLPKYAEVLAIDSVSVKVY